MVKSALFLLLLSCAALLCACKKDDKAPPVATTPIMPNTPDTPQSTVPHVVKTYLPRMIKMWNWSRFSSSWSHIRPRTDSIWSDSSAPIEQVSDTSIRFLGQTLVYNTDPYPGESSGFGVTIDTTDHLSFVNPNMKYHNVHSLTYYFKEDSARYYTIPARGLGGGRSITYFSK